MAQSPPFKVYRDGEYIGSCKYAEDAAALIAINGIGVVKFGHRHVVWREGSEEISASESYDSAAKIMYRRVNELWDRIRLA